VTEHRLEHNRLKGVAGDALNAILSASAMNFHKFLGACGAISCAACCASGARFRPCNSDASSNRSPQRLKATFSGSTSYLGVALGGVIVPQSKDNKTFTVYLLSNVNNFT
jgi:hypothetical protein